jgi:hypothetical protein
MNAAFVIHFLCDHEKGWDRMMLQKKMGGRGLCLRDSLVWMEAANAAIEQSGKDCMEGLFAYRSLSSPPASSLVYLVYRAEQSPGERSLTQQHSLFFPLLFILVAGTHVISFFSPPLDVFLV